MASDVDICNGALILIGDNVIMSLDDDSDAAKACRTLYSDERDAALADHPWNFATKRTSLARNATAPLYDYLYAYTLPVDGLRVLSKQNEETYPWKVENGLLLTDDTTAWIKYIYQVTDPARYSSTFKEALKHRLAAKLCVPLTAKRGNAQDFWKAYAGILQSAKTNDGFEGSAEVDDNNPYADVRN